MNDANGEPRNKRILIRCSATFERKVDELVALFVREEDAPGGRSGVMRRAVLELYARRIERRKAA